MPVRGCVGDQACAEYRAPPGPRAWMRRSKKPTRSTERLRCPRADVSVKKANAEHRAPSDSGARMRRCNGCAGQNTERRPCTPPMRRGVGRGGPYLRGRRVSAETVRDGGQPRRALLQQRMPELELPRVASAETSTACGRAELPSRRRRPMPLDAAARCCSNARSAAREGPNKRCAPGATRGHCCSNARLGVAIAGDARFRGNVGVAARTLPLRAVHGGVWVADRSAAATRPAPPGTHVGRALHRLLPPRPPRHRRHVGGWGTDAGAAATRPVPPGSYRDLQGNVVRWCSVLPTSAALPDACAGPRRRCCSNVRPTRTPRLVRCRGDVYAFWGRRTSAWCAPVLADIASVAAATCAPHERRGWCAAAETSARCGDDAARVVRVRPRGHRARCCSNGRPTHAAVGAMPRRRLRVVGTTHLRVVRVRPRRHRGRCCSNLGAAQMPQLLRFPGSAFSLRGACTSASCPTFCRHRGRCCSNVRPVQLRRMVRFRGSARFSAGRRGTSNVVAAVREHERVAAATCARHTCPGYPLASKRRALPRRYRRLAGRVRHLREPGGRCCSNVRPPQRALHRRPAAER